MRFFNTAGPVNCADHYCLPPLERFDLAQILNLSGQMTSRPIASFAP